jgi:hypothetical protein
MVDPLLAFPSFQKWVTHSAGGRSRSYLIANDGRVLAHSQKALISADFSNLPIFQNLLRRALQGTLTSGMGDFKGIDHLDVGAAFVRLNPFPVAVVVEEVNSEKLNQPNGVRIAFLGFMALLVLAAVVLSSALFLASYLVKTVTLTVHSESSDFDDSESLSVQEPERTKSKNGFFSGDEMLLLDSIRSSNKGDFDT